MSVHAHLAPARHRNLRADCPDAAATGARTAWRLRLVSRNARGFGCKGARPCWLARKQPREVYAALMQCAWGTLAKFARKGREPATTTRMCIWSNPGSSEICENRKVCEKRREAVSEARHGVA